MSRTNSKTARSLRSQDTHEAKKLLVKASNNPIRKDEVFDALAASSDRYLEKLSKLTEFKTKSKQSTKLNAGKSEWMSEHSSLEKSAIGIENDIMNLMEVWILQSMNDPELGELTQDVEEVRTAISVHKLELKNQLRELRTMLRAATDQVPKLAITEKENESGKPRFHEAVCIAAELLLSIRQDHNDRASNLQQFEQQYEIELLEYRRRLLAMWKEEAAGAANLELQSMLSCVTLETSDTTQPLDEQAVTRQQEQYLLVSEWCQRMRLLEKNFDLGVAVLEAEKQALQLELGVDPIGESSESVTDLRYGGWTADDHTLFLKIYKESRRTTNAVAGRSVLSDLLHTQLPHKSHEELSIHEDWYRKTKILATRKAEMISKFEVDCAELIAQAKASLAALQTKLAEQAIRDEQIRAHELNREQLHVKLQELKLQQMERDEVLSKYERERKEADLQAELERYEASKAAAAMKRLEIDAYRLQKEQEQKVLFELQEKQRQDERTKIKLEIERNRINVERRQELIQQKDLEIRRKEEAIQLQESKRLAALLQLASQVPYWDQIQNVESKLDHVTAATKAQEYIASEDPGVRGHLPLYGFADKKIIKDARFRLATALRAAGVHSSEAAKAVVSSAFQRPHLAIHGIL